MVEEQVQRVIADAAGEFIRAGHAGMVGGAAATVKKALSDILPEIEWWVDEHRIAMLEGNGWHQIQLWVGPVINGVTVAKMYLVRAQDQRNLER